MTQELSNSALEKALRESGGLMRMEEKERELLVSSILSMSNEEKKKIYKRLLDEKENIKTIENKYAKEVKEIEDKYIPLIKEGQAKIKKDTLTRNESLSEEAEQGKIEKIEEYINGM